MYDGDGGDRKLIWIIVIFGLFLIVIGAFSSESPGCGSFLLLLLLIIILWRLGAGTFIWNVFRFLFNELVKLLV